MKIKKLLKLFNMIKVFHFKSKLSQKGKDECWMKEKNWISSRIKKEMNKKLKDVARLWNAKYSEKF